MAMTEAQEDQEHAKIILKEFDDVAKFAAEIAKRAKGIPNSDLASTMLVNLAEELDGRVDGLKRLTRAACSHDMGMFY